jgi:hypothetical protein
MDQHFSVSSTTSDIDFVITNQANIYNSVSNISSILNISAIDEFVSNLYLDQINVLCTAITQVH